MLPHWTKNDIVLGTADFITFAPAMATNRLWCSSTVSPIMACAGCRWHAIWKRTTTSSSPDARGHGLSARVRPGEPIDGAADVAGLIAALGLPGRSSAAIRWAVVRRPSSARASRLSSGADPGRPGLGRPTVHRRAAAGQSAPARGWTDRALSVPELVALGRARNPTWLEIEWPAWAESKLQVDRIFRRLVPNRKPWRDYVAALAVLYALVDGRSHARGAIVTPAMAEEAASLTDVLQVAAVADAGHNIRRENCRPTCEPCELFLDQLR